MLLSCCNLETTLPDLEDGEEVGLVAYNTEKADQENSDMAQGLLYTYKHCYTTADNLIYTQYHSYLQVGLLAGAP